MRGTPGGSQNLCTGSFVLSNVCRAPNGGLTPLNFSAAQGVMGACSGCLANGSEESHVLTLVPSAPLKSASQVPERSGIPLAIRPGCRVFGSPDPGAVCAGKLEENANADANAAVKIATRIGIFFVLRANGLT